MERRVVLVANTIGELAGLSIGTRIATNHDRLLTLQDYPGGPHWFEKDGLTPFSPLHEWLPVVILSSSMESSREDL